MNEVFPTRPDPFAQDFGLCTAPHPFGVFYRLQGPNDDDARMAPQRKPRRLFCPRCDFAKLRHERNGAKGGANGGEVLAKP
jgi:hypothetical protein